ncbi:hypothetical protein BKA70DRAFT_1416826 [Coprinopsis sp. MPI-PUGE-AT-0042]|nr:hypothetical protein BKA70DRAFT_1416826 [Coprinopsis sp. MPI-PUGE-AT-0042]
MTPPPRDDRHTRHVGTHAPSQPATSPRCITPKANHCAWAMSLLTRASTQPTPAAAHGPCGFSHTLPCALTRTPIPADASGCARATSLLTRSPSKLMPAAAHGPRRFAYTYCPRRRQRLHTGHVASHTPHTRPIQANASHRACAMSHPLRTGDVAANVAWHVSASAHRQRRSCIITPSHATGHSRRQQARTGHVTARSPHNVITTTPLLPHP